MAIEVSILIVNWNGRALLPDCLASLPAGAMGLSYQVIVVDNASQDESVAWLESAAPQVQLIRNAANLGFARANNQALQTAQGAYALLLNNDARLRPGTLRYLHEFMEAHPAVGAVSPRLVTPQSEPQAYAFGQDPTPAYLLRRGLWRWLAHRPLHDWGISRAQRVDWVAGTCLLVRRAAWESVGLLDEGFFMYFEDNDWCLRMRRAGWEVWYMPEVEVEHLGGQSVQRNPRAQAAYEQSLRYFYRKHYGPLARLALAVMLPVYRRLRP